MFSFFNKKSGPDTTDKVWLSTQAMFAGLAKWLEQQPNRLIVSWFVNDRNELLKALPAAAGDRVILASQLTQHQAESHLLLFAGHYPLQQVEADFAEKLGLKKMLVHSSLTSPLFKHFGGDKIIDTARSMGMKEDEAIEHFLVSSAIGKTQGKIADKVTNEMLANSESEWMQLNLAAE